MTGNHTLVRKLYEHRRAFARDSIGNPYAQGAMKGLSMAARILAEEIRKRRLPPMPPRGARHAADIASLALRCLLRGERSKAIAVLRRLDHQAIAP